MHLASPAQIFGVDGVIILMVVTLVLFGSSQIPKVARSLGSAQKEFKKGVDDGASEGGTGQTSAVPVGPPAAVSAPAQTAEAAEASGARSPTT